MEIFASDVGARLSALAAGEPRGAPSVHGGGPGVAASSSMRSQGEREREELRQSRDLAKSEIARLLSAYLNSWPSP